MFFIMSSRTTPIVNQNDSSTHAPTRTANPVRSTTTDYAVFHVDFIDTPKFHTRMAEILQGGSIEPGHGYVPTTETTTPGSGDGLSKVSISLIIPLCTISAFMLIVGLCLMLNAWYDKRQSREYPVTNVSGSYRANSNWVEPTTSPLRSSSGKIGKTSFVGEGFKSQLDTINEQPEKAGLGQYPVEDSVFSPADSMVSMMSNYGVDFTPLYGGIPYFSPGYTREVSHSYPNLILAAQAPFSPYHITWVSPNLGPNRVSRSDPDTLNVVPRRPPIATIARQMSARPGNANVEGANTFEQSRHTANYIWKSPYHPNNNTPTGSDGEAVPPSVYVNRPGATDPPPPYSHIETPDAGPSREENSPRSMRSGAPVMSMEPTGSTLDRRNTNSYSTPAIGANEDDLPGHVDRSLALSCPTNVGHWEYSNPYMFPSLLSDDPQGMPTIYDQVCNEARYPHAHHGYDPNAFCDICHFGVLYESSSMYPMVGSYSNSAYLQSSAPSNNASSRGFSSANGSLAVHMDSSENTGYSSSAATTYLTSEQSQSSYTAGPGHSTSLGISSTNASGYPSGANSLNIIQGLSAINQKHSNGQTHGSDAMSATIKSAPAVLSNPLNERPVSIHSTDSDTSGTVNNSVVDPRDMSVVDGYYSPVSQTDSSIQSVKLTHFPNPSWNPSDEESKNFQNRSPDSSNAVTAIYEWDSFPYTNKNIRESEESNPKGNTRPVTASPSRQSQADLAVDTYHHRNSQNNSDQHSDDDISLQWGPSNQQVGHVPPHRRRLSDQPVDGPPLRRRLSDQPVNGPPLRRRLSDQPVNGPPLRRRLSDQPVNGPPLRRRLSDQPVNGPPLRRRLSDQPFDVLPLRHRLSNQPVDVLPLRRMLSDQPVNNIPPSRRRLSDQPFDSIPQHRRRLSGPPVDTVPHRRRFSDQPVDIVTQGGRRLSDQPVSSIPPPRRRLSDQPVLSDTQYWV